MFIDHQLYIVMRLIPPKVFVFSCNVITVKYKLNVHNYLQAYMYVYICMCMYEFKIIDKN